MVETARVYVYSGVYVQQVIIQLVSHKYCANLSFVICGDRFVRFDQKSSVFKLQVWYIAVRITNQLVNLGRKEPQVIISSTIETLLISPTFILVKNKNYYKYFN